MFSREQAISPDAANTIDIYSFIEFYFSIFLKQNDMCAGIICLIDEKSQNFDVIATYGISKTPLKGNKKEYLQSIIEECCREYSLPHVHHISKSQFWKELSSIKNTENWQRSIFFLPAYYKQYYFIFICFRDSKSRMIITEDIKTSLSDTVILAELLLSTDSLKYHLEKMEYYVKEIGHDIASSVQAIYSKLRNISKGYITGSLAVKKIEEAEYEILSTYRVADSLGITVDPDYNIKSGDYFNPNEIIKESIILFQSEADERHIVLEPTYFNKNTQLWGDAKAIQSALYQLIMNAIKYAKGSSYIMIYVNEKTGEFEYGVTDYGLPLDKNDENHIWEFGWRGNKAKELHVNGSGIGLYTVNKIVKAHGGSVGCIARGDRRDHVTFYFRIPKKDIIKKIQLIK